MRKFPTIIGKAQYEDENNYFQRLSETVNVVYMNSSIADQGYGNRQSVVYLPIHDVEAKCFPTGNPHVFDPTSRLDGKPEGFQGPLSANYPEEFESYIVEEELSDEEACDLFIQIEKRADDCETSWGVAFKDHIT